MRIKYLILLFFLVACNHAAIMDKSDKSSFFKIVQGEWLNNDFIQKIKQTKSPHKSYNDDLVYSALSIDTSSCSNDTLKIGCSLNNNHEAFEFKAFFMNKDMLTTDISNYQNNKHIYRLILNIRGNDTLLFLNEYTNTSHLIKSIQYKKIKTKTHRNEVGSCINEFVMDYLFAGKYKLFTNKDSDLNKQIIFSKYGNVSPLYGKRFYDVQDDFIGSYENLDQIFFIDLKKDYSKCLTKFYKWHMDTLLIYKTKQAVETGWDTIADLEYKLIKIK